MGLRENLVRCIAATLPLVAVLSSAEDLSLAPKKFEPGTCAFVLEAATQNMKCALSDSIPFKVYDELKQLQSCESSETTDPEAKKSCCAPLEMATRDILLLMGESAEDVVEKLGELKFPSVNDLILDTESRTLFLM